MPSSSVSSGASSLGSLSKEVATPTSLKLRRGPVTQRNSVVALNPPKRRYDKAEHLPIDTMSPSKVEPRPIGRPTRNVLIRRSELPCLRLLRVGSRNRLGVEAGSPY